MANLVPVPTPTVFIGPGKPTVPPPGVSFDGWFVDSLLPVLISAVVSVLIAVFVARYTSDRAAGLSREERNDDRYRRLEERRDEAYFALSACRMAMLRAAAKDVSDPSASWVTVIADLDRATFFIHTLAGSDRELGKFVNAFLTYVGEALTRAATSAAGPEELPDDLLEFFVVAAFAIRRRLTNPRFRLPPIPEMQPPRATPVQTDTAESEGHSSRS